MENNQALEGILLIILLLYYFTLSKILLIRKSFNQEKREDIFQLTVPSSLEIVVIF